MSNKAAGSASKPAAVVAPKSTPPKQSASAASAQAAANKMHKRSRSGKTLIHPFHEPISASSRRCKRAARSNPADTLCPSAGCFTCRLRRKKCDEGKPYCKACRHLGLKCEYKRPLWWSNNEQRRAQKEMIKNIIKRTKLSEKSSKDANATGADSPPGLTHSLPTSATYSDAAGRTRAPSEDSSCSLDFNAPYTNEPQDLYHPQVYTPQFDAHSHSYPFPPTPYEVDIKTERQMYVNGEPTRRDSSISTFSTYHPPPPHSNLATVPEDEWGLHEDMYETHGDMFSHEEPIDFGYFDFQHPQAHSEQALVQVDECDRHLLEHFIDNVLRLIFPILEANQHGSPRSDVILPALESNKCYLHCCLSIAAIHLKSTLPSSSLPNEQLDADIVRHRYATISELCDALNRDTDHVQILEATLGMIFFHCSVGRADDTLPDIPWHQHFQAATSLVRKLQLPETLASVNTASAVPAHPPFNMTLTAWIDIFGATMMGRAPQFANTYREMHLSSSSSGLLELMGCEDRMMYLISEIACLEALKLTHSLDETTLCSHITLLAQQIDTTETPDSQLESAVSTNGAVRPRVLARTMTALFRKAARIWLLSLIPGMTRSSTALYNLVSQFTDLLAYIPTGQGGFDRSIVWPLLMAGAQSTSSSPLRAAIEERVESMGEHKDLGAFGRVRRLLGEVWAQNDGAEGGPDEAARSVHWRDVMRARGWDFLLL
ncbi:MAG: hypothetical protein MMC23_002255 [Stictis urceolatum]|nr:hypothetical protein [Stictis urceolata]